jgi:hypothetical protein
MEYRNPVYAAPDGTMIDCEVNHPVLGWIAFTATPHDPHQYGRELHELIIARGGNIKIGPYVPPPPRESAATGVMPTKIA